MMSRNDKTLKLAVVGAGSRGRAYSLYSDNHSDELEIVAVAEKNQLRRENFSKCYNIPKQLQFSSGEEMLKAAPTADAVLIATPDRTHIDMAAGFAEAGYNLLLEKPIATTRQEVNKFADLVNNRKNQLFGVCHVLLYTPLTKKVKAIIDNGDLGSIVSIQRLEPIGYWHYIHSYVRGNWRREDISSPLLLAKSCHDIDWIMHMVDDTVCSVSSYGFLNHFHAGSKPDKAGKRCVNCGIEDYCAFSAKRFYTSQLENGKHCWPLDTVIDKFSSEALDHALATGPYGRCVYDCDNSVVDNQVVNIKFANNKTANFAVEAFSDVDYRKTRIFGTAGMLNTDGLSIKVFSFLTNSWKEYSVDVTGMATASGGHGGGDFGLMEAYIAAWRSGDYTSMNRQTMKGCLSHDVVFAAEESRLEEQVVAMN